MIIDYVCILESRTITFIHDDCLYFLQFEKNRSPEEYLYVEETEKVDIYSLGNIFYFLLVGERVFSELDNDDVYDLVKKGERSPIPSKFTTMSEDPVHKAIIKAIEMCWIQDPEDRATSKEVAKYLTAMSKLILGSNYTYPIAT
jgi:serine/threonine protein kinase